MFNQIPDIKCTFTCYYCRKQSGPVYTSNYRQLPYFDLKDKNPTWIIDKHRAFCGEQCKKWWYVEFGKAFGVVE